MPQPDTFREGVTTEQYQYTTQNPRSPREFMVGSIPTSLANSASRTNSVGPNQGPPSRWPVTADVSNGRCILSGKESVYHIADLIKQSNAQIKTGVVHLSSDDPRQQSHNQTSDNVIKQFNQGGPMIPNQGYSRHERLATEETTTNKRKRQVVDFQNHSIERVASQKVVFNQVQSTNDPNYAESASRQDNMGSNIGPFTQGNGDFQSSGSPMQEAVDNENENELRDSNQNLEMSQDMLFMNSNVDNLKANFPVETSVPFKSLSPSRKTDAKNSSCVTLEKVKQLPNEESGRNSQRQDSTIQAGENEDEKKKLTDLPTFTAQITSSRRKDEKEQDEKHKSEEKEIREQMQRMQDQFNNSVQQGSLSMFFEKRNGSYNGQQTGRPNPNYQEVEMSKVQLQLNHNAGLASIMNSGFQNKPMTAPSGKRQRGQNFNKQQPSEDQFMHQASAISASKSTSGFASPKNSVHQIQQQHIQINEKNREILKYQLSYQHPSQLNLIMFNSLPNEIPAPAPPNQAELKQQETDRLILSQVEQERLLRSLISSANSQDNQLSEKKHQNCVKCCDHAELYEEKVNLKDDFLPNHLLTKTLQNRGTRFHQKSSVSGGRHGKSSPSQLKSLMLTARLLQNKNDEEVDPKEDLLNPMEEQIKIIKQSPCWEQAQITNFQNRIIRDPSGKMNQRFTVTGNDCNTISITSRIQQYQHQFAEKRHSSLSSFRSHLGQVYRGPVDIPQPTMSQSPGPITISKTVTGAVTSPVYQKIAGCVVLDPVADKPKEDFTIQNQTTHQSMVKFRDMGTLRKYLNTRSNKEGSKTIAQSSQIVELLQMQQKPLKQRRETSVDRLGRKSKGLEKAPVSMLFGEQARINQSLGAFAELGGIQKSSTSKIQMGKQFSQRPPRATHGNPHNIQKAKFPSTVRIDRMVSQRDVVQGMLMTQANNHSQISNASSNKIHTIELFQPKREQQARKSPFGGGTIIGNLPQQHKSRVPAWVESNNFVTLSDSGLVDRMGNDRDSQGGHDVTNNTQNQTVYSHSQGDALGQITGQPMLSINKEMAATYTNAKTFTGTEEPKEPQSGIQLFNAKKLIGKLPSQSLPQTAGGPRKTSGLFPRRNQKSIQGLASKATVASIRTAGDRSDNNRGKVNIDLRLTRMDPPQNTEQVIMPQALPKSTHQAIRIQKQIQIIDKKVEAIAVAYENI